MHGVGISYLISDIPYLVCERYMNIEALAGEWKGYRSSQLNLQYRIIYKVEGDRILVQAKNVTPRNYRKAKRAVEVSVEVSCFNNRSICRATNNGVAEPKYSAR